MKTLGRNKTTVYYALFQSKTELTDTNGDYTGAWSYTYSTPVAWKVNVSANKGSMDREMFGLTSDYTKVLVSDTCPIQENSILWVGITPDANGEAGTVKHNFVVTQIAKSLNSVAIAIKQND